MQALFLYLFVLLLQVVQGSQPASQRTTANSSVPGANTWELAHNV